MSEQPRVVLEKHSEKKKKKRKTQRIPISPHFPLVQLSDPFLRKYTIGQEWGEMFYLPLVPRRTLDWLYIFIF